MTTLVTVAGQYQLPGVTSSQTPGAVGPTGFVTFQPTVSRYLDNDLGEIICGAQTVPLAAGTGLVEIQLQATDDPAITPTGWQYQVTVSLTGVDGYTFRMSVPSALAESGLNLATVTPLPTV
jgi:hypothetical protein